MPDDFFKADLGAQIFLNLLTMMYVLIMKAFLLDPLSYFHVITPYLYNIVVQNHIFQENHSHLSLAV